jgi:MFS family permease
MMLGFVLMGPLSGKLSDRFGSRPFAIVGLLIQIVGFLLLTLLPANFDYLWFALLLVAMGVGQGMFSAPNTTMVMNSVPIDQRGVASGMRATFMNTAAVISMTMFFSIVTAGLAQSLPSTLYNGLTQAGLSQSVAQQISHLPPIAALFAAFLGYNPMQTLLPESALHSLPVASQHQLLGQSFFPNLISVPFMNGLSATFILAASLCLIALVASLVREKKGGRGVAIEEVEEIDGEVVSLADNN